MGTRDGVDDGCDVGAAVGTKVGTAVGAVCSWRLALVPRSSEGISVGDDVTIACRREGTGPTIGCDVGFSEYSRSGMDLLFNEIEDSATMAGPKST